jgi:hypothetical protein
MSRDAKSKKLKRQRERDYREKKATRAYESPEKSRLSGKQLLHISYNVTFEPLDLKEPARERLESAVGVDALEKLFFQAREEPHAAIPRLRSLLDDYPDVPALYNWLAVAYRCADEDEKAEEIDRLNFERHPDYLFALMPECHRLLDEGNVERVTQLLDKRFDLKIMYPERDVFHITEVMPFSHLMVRYFVATDQLEPARVILRGIEQLDPESPFTTAARLLLLSKTKFSFIERLKRQAMSR